MTENQVMERIRTLCAAYGWTYYRLAKESGIPYSTLNTMLHKTYTPSVSTLIKLCDGFGITLSQFFDENYTSAPLAPEQRELLAVWESLSPEDRASALQYMGYLAAQRGS